VVANKDFAENEKVRFIIWYFAGCVESVTVILLLISILFTKPDCATNWQDALLIILALLALIETLSIYKYFETPLMNLLDLKRRINTAVKSWRTKE